MLGRPAALLTVAALAVGGCASGKVREANDYVSAVNSAQSSFAATSEQLLAKMTPGGKVRGARATLGRFYAAIDGVISRLRAIRPPARVHALHASLISELQAFDVGLRAAGTDLVSGNAIRVLDGQQKLAQATAEFSGRLNATMAKINAALHG